MPAIFLSIVQSRDSARLSCQRQHDVDAKTSAMSILGRDLATMKANDAVSDRQSKTSPA